MRKLKSYFEETYTELVQKTSWPTWTELQSRAIIVMVASVIIALVVFLMDTGFSWTLEKVYQMFS